MDGDASTLLGACLLAFLLILNFIMTAFSAAIRSVSDTEIQEAFESEGKPPDEICELKDHSDRLIHTIWLLTAVTYTAAGYFLTGLTRRYPIYVTLPLLAILFYLFGNSIPEMLGHKNASRWLLHRSGVVRVVMLAVSPLTYIMTFVSHVCVRILGIDPKSFESEVTEDEIISMVNEGHEQGVLRENEAEMIHNIFEFGDKEAGDIMTHRKNISALDGNDIFEDVITLVIDSHYSRMPVYSDTIDNIIGVLHIKETLSYSRQPELLKKPIKEIDGLIRPVDFIPETRNINALFQEMQSAKEHMVIVVDEYGQTAGLVTMEDILEEIVGNILDEHDEEDTYIEKKPDGTFVMNGMTPLEEVGEALNLDFEDEDYDTLNGLLISLIDKIPSEHEVFEVKYKGYIFEVLSVEDKMIKYVHVVPERSESAESDTATCQQDEKMVE